MSDFSYVSFDEYMLNNRKNIGMLLFKPNVQVCFHLSFELWWIVVCKVNAACFIKLIKISCSHLSEFS